MIAFALAVFFLIITPGPGVLSIAGVGAAFGRTAGLRYMIGLFIGTNLTALMVVSGLAAALMADGRIRTVLATLSIAYLLYLAFRIAFAGSRIAFIRRAAPPGVRGGILLQLVNPKSYAVNVALFSGFVIYPEDPALEVVLKFLVMGAIWVPIHSLWLWAGLRLEALDLPEGRQRAINVAMAAAMLIVVALAVFAPG